MAVGFNHPIVKEMDVKIKQIDESLSISSISSCEGKIRSVGCFLPLKGNADIIKRLKRIGFIEHYREKRGDSFYQKMECHINYDKYAIYQGPIGKYSMLYIDNIFDFKRHGILGNPYNIDFPIVVNRNGGRHTFDKKYEKGFLYIKEVLEDEEPLTREEMFPKNSKDFVYGWIDREGNTYACSFENHYRAAEYLCLEKGINSYNEERTLEEAGWIKISRKAPYTPENEGSQNIYIDHNIKITQAQINTLYDLGLDNDRTFKYLLKYFEEEFER